MNTTELLFNIYNAGRPACVRLSVGGTTFIVTLETVKGNERGLMAYNMESGMYSLILGSNGYWIRGADCPDFAHVSQGVVA